MERDLSGVRWACAGLAVLCMLASPAAANVGEVVQRPLPTGETPMPPRSTAPGDRVQSAEAREQQAAGTAARAVDAQDAAAAKADETQPEETSEIPLPQSSLFLERTHFGFLRMRRMTRDNHLEEPIVFEGEPALHIFIWNELSQLAWQLGTEHKALIWPVISTTFYPMVRMLSDGKYSEPVYSPSWRIRLPNLQWFGMWGLGERPGSGIGIWEVRLSLEHYSNGQNGCPFLPPPLDIHTELKDPACAALDLTQVDLSKVNRIDGDYSTNRIAIAGHLRLIETYGAGEQQARTERSSHTLGGLLEWVTPPDWKVPPFGNIPAQLEKVHHRGRVRLDYRMEMSLGRQPYLFNEAPVRFAAELYGEALLGVPEATRDHVASSRVGMELALTLPRANDLGVFVSLFRGADYYNLRYVDDVDVQLMVGLVMELYERPIYRQ